MFICSSLQFICCFCSVKSFGAWPLPVLHFKIFIITSHKQLRMNKLSSRYGGSCWVCVYVCVYFSMILKCVLLHSHAAQNINIFQTFKWDHYRGLMKMKLTIVAVTSVSLWLKWCFGHNRVGSDFFNQTQHHLGSIETLMNWIVFALLTHIEKFSLETNRGWKSYWWHFCLSTGFIQMSHN